MRKNPPSLVILDLNNARIAAARHRRRHEGRTRRSRRSRRVGYASHVQTDVIDAARQAGVGEVLARSAFTQQLAGILTASA